MTDEELDALVHTLWHGEVTLATVASSADAITTLRAQLAEAHTRIEAICPSCKEPLDWPSGDGCANMTKHIKN